MAINRWVIPTDGLKLQGDDVHTIISDSKPSEVNHHSCKTQRIDCSNISRVATEPFLVPVDAVFDWPVAKLDKNSSLFWSAIRTTPEIPYSNSQIFFPTT